MGKFTRSTTVNGSYKELCINNGSLVDFETGEMIDLISDLQSVYGEGTVFSLSTKMKYDSEIDPSEEEGNL